MSFIQTDTTAKAYAPGYFLKDDENCVRETRQIAQSGATSERGGKVVKMGTFYPANNSSTVEGIVYEDVDVTTGDMPGSVVTKGVVYLDKLPASPESGVQSALEAKGFKFITSTPAVIRPEWVNNGSLTTLTVESSASASNTGKTVIDPNYTLKAGEGFLYKTDSTTAPAVTYRQKLDTTSWTSWNGTDEITATTGHKITVAVVDTLGEAVAAGSATVTSKAAG